MGSFLAVVAVVQLNTLNNFMVERAATFQDVISDTITAALKTSAPLGIAGYATASQLNINNGIKDGVKTLTDPATIEAINPPYQKLLVINTKTPTSVTITPAIFPVLLTTGTEGANYRLQNCLVIYIMNANPYTHFTFGSKVTAPVDGGILNILNAYSPVPADGYSKQDSSYGGTNDVYPTFKGNGVLIYPGEVKCFVNVGVNLPFPKSIPFAKDNWVELTADVRPFVQKVTFTADGSLIPTHRIENIVSDRDLTITINNNYAYDGQELIIVANINDDDGSDKIHIDTSVTQTGFPLDMTNLQKLTLQYNKTSSKEGTGTWIIISGPS